MKQKTLHSRFGIVAITTGTILIVVIFLSAYVITALAYNGPSQNPPSGYGTIGSDASNNVSIGSSTTISGTKLAVVGASSDNTTNAAQFLKNNGTPIFILRDDGSVSIATSTVSAGNILMGEALTVGGNVTANQFVGTINASLVTAGAFPGGNYTFPSNVYFPGSGIWNSSGDIGIGTTSPSAPLVIVDALGTNTLNGSGMSVNRSFAYIGTVTSGQVFNIKTDDFRVRNQGDTTSNLEVTATNTNVSGVLAVSGTGYSSIAGALTIGTQFLGTRDSAAVPSFSWSGDTNTGLFEPAADTIGFSIAGAEKVRISSGGYVGIGTTNPSTALTVVGNVSSTGICLGGICNTSWPSGGGGTVTSVTAGSGLSGGTITGSGTISLNLGSGNTWTSAQTFNGVLTVNNNLTVGANKITAGTIDPLYTIDGTNYATYLPGMTGENEETAGTLTLQKSVDGTYSATVDFATAAKGSNFWLFAQATNLKNTMDALVVSLTPSFDGNVWYTKDAAADTLVIHGASSGEVSYNLTAPRFDAAKWTNLAPSDESSTTGLLIDTQ